MLKVFSEGLKYAPKLNGHISYNKDTKEGEIRTIENINVNMPWILPSGKMMTITISNIGSTYREQRGTISMLDIIPPQVCVIGFGSIQENIFFVYDKGIRKSLIQKQIKMQHLCE